MKVNNDKIYKYISKNVRTSTNKQDDKFVGITYCNQKFEITFPVGFTITKPSIEIKNSLERFRQDVKLLIYTIKKYYEIRDIDDVNSNFNRQFYQKGNNRFKNNLPLHSYNFIINDFINNGYYIEIENINKVSNSGKINWHRTIKQTKPIFDNNNAIFLKIIRRKHNVLDNELITLLHKTCVHESFNKIGFLYFDNDIVEKPLISILEARKYIHFLKSKISKTFRDREKVLFNHMLNIIEWSETFSDNNEYKYGVPYFHPVWEKMIDYVFGIDDISKYYPRAHWFFKTINPIPSSNMRQDSIMFYKNDIYILDAKYYGVGKLPGTADTNKQVTYGKVVETIESKEPYNAFLLPKEIKDNSMFEYIGYSTINTLSFYNNKKYGKVAGIYVNVNQLMELKYEKANKILKKLLVSKIKECMEQHIKTI